MARLGGAICVQVQPSFGAPSRCWEVQLVGLALLPNEEFLAISSHPPSWCRAAISMANLLPESRLR